jgi:glutamate carboxypeptidase
LKKLLAGFLLCVSLPTYGAPLSKTEKKIMAAAQASSDEALQLLERTVNINSGTMNPEGVQQVAEVFEKEFADLGFKTTWIPMKEVHRAGHLFAEIKGTSGKKLLLIGHLDTVFEKDSAFALFQRKDSKATGQGVNDMKGGDVIILYALKALRKVDALKNKNIIIAFLGDEEKPGMPLTTSRKDLIDAAKRSDIALGFETAIDMQTATVARRGVSTWLLQVKARQAHSSGIFSKEDGSGAVFEASRILHTFYEQMRAEKYLTFNPAVILGGTEVTFDTETSKGTSFGKTNVIAQSATARGDLRFLTDAQKQAAQDKMRKIVSESLPGASAEIQFEDTYPSMAPTEGNLELLKILDTVSRDLGLGEVKAYDPGGRGAADISFVASYVDGLDGLGAIGEGAHTSAEDIDLSTFPHLITRTALLIYRLTCVK